MFLKSKLCLTIVALYEVVAVVLLHIPRTCDAMFCGGFCDEHIFKYFIVCVAVPVLVLLAAMWVRELVHAVRRRHSLSYRARAAVSDVVSNMRKHIRKNVSTTDIEKYLTAALVVGLKQYSAKHPGVMDAFNRILNETEYNVDIPDFGTAAPRSSSTRTASRPPKGAKRKSGAASFGKQK